MKYENQKKNILYYELFSYLQFHIDKYFKIVCVIRAWKVLSTLADVDDCTYFREFEVEVEVEVGIQVNQWIYWFL